MLTQTAGLAVSYFDRYLSQTQRSGLEEQRVQLASITVVLIAAKFSDIKMPCLDDLCEVAHDKYSKAQLKESELETLRVLQWELNAVTPHAALEQLAIVMNHTVDRSEILLEHAEFFVDMSYYVVSPHLDLISTPSRPHLDPLARKPCPRTCMAPAKQHP